MRTMRSILAVAASVAALAAGDALAAPNFKLKPGGQGQVCIDCHTEFQKLLKKPVIHTPVRSRDCVGCHNPHAGDHPKLLVGEPSEVCGTCHADMAPAKARSRHQPVVERRCTACHDPHASDTKFVLVKPGAALCASCHKDLVERSASVKFKHRPVVNGCEGCHDGHASDKAAHLLKKDVPGLCTDCHKVDKPIFVKQHLDYPVGKSDCTSCHDPHGSSRKGILYDQVHAPVARGMCTQCHLPAASPDRFKTKQAGVELCRGCHGPMVGKVLDKNRVHQPIVEEQACLSCHSPHASKQKALLRAPAKALCGSCHADTIRRADLSPTKHEPVEQGDCTTCHDPHSGDAPLLFVKPSGIEVCGACHNYATHQSHPIGEKIRDPRSRNLTLECVSCHRAHGTEYKKLMPFQTTSDLCVRCHQQYRR